MSNYGDQFMLCPECGGRAESDAVDVGVGLYIAGNFVCDCGWEYEADGMARVGSYDDWFPDLPHGLKHHTFGGETKVEGITWT